MTLAIWILLSAALLLWGVTCAGVATLHSDDPAGRSLGEVYSIFMMLGVWVLLAAVLVLAGLRSGMSYWTASLALILHPTSCAAALHAVHLIARGKQNLWLIGVPLLAVPMLAGFVVWLVTPSLRAAIPWTQVHVTVWGVLSVLVCAPWIAAAVSARGEKRIQQDQQTKLESELARYHALPQETPLWERIPFTLETSVGHEQVWQHLKQFPRRQADAETMLQRGEKWPLVNYWKLDLRATPALCSGTRILLRSEIQSIVRTQQGGTYAEDVERIEVYLAPMQWLSQHGCSLKEEAALMEAAINAYPASESRDWFVKMLKRL